MSCSNRNDFEKVDGGALIKDGRWSNAKKECKIYISNKKENADV